MIKCPKCKSEKFYYVQKATEYHTILDYDEDGFFDLGSLVESIPADDYSLYCKSCHSIFDSLEGYDKEILTAGDPGRDASGARKKRSVKGGSRHE